MNKKSHSEFMDELKFKNIYAYNNLAFLEKYKTLKTKILAKDKYGKLMVRPDDLLSGSYPSINSAVNKNEYFTNQAIEVHGDKYDYSKVDFKNNNSNVKILCNEHGEFEQIPYHHLAGHGCIKCGFNSSLGKYSASNAEKYKCDWENKKALVYILSFFENENHIFKIGITTNDVKERYRIEHTFKYDYLIEYQKEMNLYNACYVENALHEHFKEYSYIPKIKFGGYTECFSNINMKEVENIVKKTLYNN